MLAAGNVGSLQFPGYPCICMPWPQIPVVPQRIALARFRLLPSKPSTSSAFRSSHCVILSTTTVHISGLNTRPANSLHPASDTASRRSPSGSLLDLLARRWSRWDSHPLGNINQFLEFLLSLILSLAGHDDGRVGPRSQAQTHDNFGIRFEQFQNTCSTETRTYRFAVDHLCL